MTFRNRIAAATLGLALVAPAIHFALAEGADRNEIVEARQRQVTLLDLLQGRAQPQRQEARNTGVASAATDAITSGSSQPVNPVHMYDYLSGPNYLGSN